jgi:hypothetical protein
MVRQEKEKQEKQEKEESHCCSSVSFTVFLITPGLGLLSHIVCVPLLCWL